MRLAGFGLCKESEFVSRTRSRDLAHGVVEGQAEDLGAEVNPSSVAVLRRVVSTAEGGWHCRPDTVEPAHEKH